MDFVSKSFDFKDGDRCVVIGEIGVNHNCDREILFKLIDKGVEAGLDIIKLQRFNTALEISSHAALADYQAEAGMVENQLEMAKALELPDDLLIEAFEYCKQKGVGFLCTAFEHESVDFLADTLGVSAVKVPSPEISNKPLLQYMAKRFDSMMISSGASYMEEVAQAINWVREVKPDIELALMHCTSQYPAPIEQCNMKVILSMREQFNLPVGYSDHTKGHVAAVVCAAMGGAMVEKHYTLDKNMVGPDHQASVDIPELKTLVKAVRDASASLGDGVKVPAATEGETRPKIRKSLYVNAENLTKGTEITADMIEKHVIGVKRPYDPEAIKPEEFDALIGKTLNVDKGHDEPLSMKDFGG